MLKFRSLQMIVIPFPSPDLVQPEHRNEIIVTTIFKLSQTQEKIPLKSFACDTVSEDTRRNVELQV